MFKIGWRLLDGSHGMLPGGQLTYPEALQDVITRNQAQGQIVYHQVVWI